MKVLQINTVYAQGSTGNIARTIHDECLNNGIQCLTAHRYFQKGAEPLNDSVEISSVWDSRIHGQISRFTMFKGVGSVIKTIAFLNKVKSYAPDIIHLHNLHGSFVNLPLLFRYIRKHNVPVVWTLHDCWSFTAICSHFTQAECDKWQTGCYSCPQKSRFSSCPFDFTKSVWKLKKKWFSTLENVTIVTPSDWLKTLVEKSYFNKYKITTIHNGIDLDVFKLTESDFRARHGLENKKIVLGVAFDWGYAKGLDVFSALADRLGDEYRIVLVGTNDRVRDTLSKNILCIDRTGNQQELAEIYSAADVFFNPTREEVLGLVNIEALACGTPVVTFPTGGSPECIDSSCGVVTDNCSVDSAQREIIRVCSEKPYKKEDCIRRAQEFDKSRRIEDYINLYKTIV